MAFITVVLPLLVLILAVMVGIILMILIGAGVLTIGIGGSVATAAAVKNKEVKRSLTPIFLATILIGLSITSILPIFLSITIDVRLIFAVIAVLNVGAILLIIKGITRVLKLEKKLIKVTLIVASTVLSLTSLFFTLAALIAFIISFPY